MIIKTADLTLTADMLALIPQRSGIPCSEYVRIVPGKKKLRFYLSSDALGRIDASAEGDFPVKSPYFVDRNLFLPFISTAKNMSSAKDFEFLEEEGQLVIKHGRRKIKFTALPPVTGYGKIQIDEANAFELELTDDQKELIRCAESCATTDPISPNLNCVYMTDQGLVMSSNQVVIFSAQAKKFAKSIPMPLYLLKLLEIKGATKLIFTDEFVVLRFPNGEILQTVPQQALKGFPSKKITSRVAESSSYHKLFSISAKKLSAVLDRFSVYMSSVRRQDRIIKMEVEKDGTIVKITSAVAQVQLVETFKLSEAAKTKVKVEIALDLVLPVFLFLGSKNRELVFSASKDTPFFIDGGNIKLLLARKA